MANLGKDITYLFLKIVHDDDPNGEATWEQFQDKRFNEDMSSRAKWNLFNSLVDGPYHVVDYFTDENWERI